MCCGIRVTGIYESDRAAKQICKMLFVYFGFVRHSFIVTDKGGGKHEEKTESP